MEIVDYLRPRGAGLALIILIPLVAAGSRGAAVPPATMYVATATVDPPRSSAGPPPSTPGRRV